MKYFAMLALVSLVGCATAQSQVGKHDLEFTAQPVYPVKRVEWVVTERVDEVCQGMAPINSNKRYIACAKFNNTSCVVYTKPNLTLAQLGHEMRHCFEGHWHR